MEEHPIIMRQELLNRLITAKKHNLVKVLTGIRRCGKSFLLFNLFKNHLLESGVAKDHIIEINLESDKFRTCRDAIALGDAIRPLLIHDGATNYILIDEIQHARPALAPGIDISRMKPKDRKYAYTTFYDVLNGLLRLGFANIYVTGSNAHLLSSDVATEFRGRGEIIEVMPLSFTEFHPILKDRFEFDQIRDAYFRYGGLPECALLETEEEKISYLNDLCESIYLRDIADRHKLRNDVLLAALTDTVMSNIGGLTNPAKLTNAINSTGKVKSNHVTVSRYLDFLEESFLIKKASRFDVKGKRYLDYPSKYYATDTGIRNARTEFRQVEKTHLMENVIYNELRRLGFCVDVGAVETFPSRGDTQTRKMNEVDFVLNKASERIYVQSAFSIPDEEKRRQETYSLTHIGDSFRKVVIVGDTRESPWRNEHGIIFMSLAQFLLDPHSLETL